MALFENYERREAKILATLKEYGINSIDECKEIAEKPFVCPNCGKEFYKKWNRLYFNGFTPKLTNKAILKCPHCKERDACRWTGMDRVGNYQ